MNDLITIELPVSKKKIELKNWLTGRERRSINNALLSDSKFNVNEMQNYQVSGDAIQKFQDAAMKAYIVSINGEKKDPQVMLDEILDLHSDDYTAVENKINELSKEETSIPKA